MASAYRDAWLDDPDVAEALAGQEEPKGGRMAVREYSTEVALLAGIFDRLAEVVNALVALGNGKPSKVNPFPRPMTGVDRARKLAEDKQFDSLLEDVAAAQARWSATRS